MKHVRINTPFDECDYQVVKETPGQSETVFGYDYEHCIEADEHCMKLNAELRAIGITEAEMWYGLEMGPNVPEPAE